MKVVPFEPWHWQALEPRPRDVQQDAMWAAADEGYTRTIFHADWPVAIVGVVVPYSGIGYVWARVGEGARGHGLGLTRAVLRCIEEARLVLAPRQLRCQVRLDNEEYRAWIQMLGFEPESIKKGAAQDGSDLVEYVLWVTSSEGTSRSLRLRRRRRTMGRCGATTRPGSGTSRRATALN